MIRPLRRRHLVTWLLIGPFILATAVFAVVIRPAEPDATPSVGETP